MIVFSIMVFEYANLSFRDHPLTLKSFSLAHFLLELNCPQTSSYIIVRNADFSPILRVLLLHYRYTTVSSLHSCFLIHCTDFMSYIFLANSCIVLVFFVFLSRYGKSWANFTVRSCYSQFVKVYYLLLYRCRRWNQQVWQSIIAKPNY